MKKIISILIISAIFISLFSTVCFAADSEVYCPPAAIWTVRSSQYPITLFGSDKSTPFKNISFNGSNSVTLTFHIVNNTDTVLNSVGLSCSWGQNVFLSESDAANGKAVSGTKRTVNIQPGSALNVDIVIPRYAYYSNVQKAITQGANDSLGVLIEGKDAGLRLDFAKTPAAGGTVTFICLTDSRVTESFASCGFLYGVSGSTLSTKKHSFVLTENELPCTATEFGGRLSVCSNCGKQYVATREALPTGFDFIGEVYEPVEIRFTSSKSYANAYTDVEINAVFTHQSGLSISLPGFWYDSDIFALRFSPTLTGKWSYTVSCTDASNTSLNGLSGIITAVPNTTGTTSTAKHGFIQISSNGRYFEYQDGTPFFWLGDTNWQAPQMLSTTKCNYPGCTCGGQFQHIVNDRVSKGFTVFQTYFADASASGNQGNASYWSVVGSLVNTDTWNNRLDYEFKYLSENDMVAVVGFGCHSSTPKNISKADMIRLARYIVARYACYNVMWFSGQEITDNNVASATDQSNGTVTTMDVYMELSATVTELDGYKHPNSSHMYPMQSSDSRAKRLADATWHDYWLLQGGHGASQQSKTFYSSYYNNKNVTTGVKVKPVIEGEANYEEINCGGFTGYNASRYCAWKSMLCGCAGFTYGATGVWIGAYSNVSGYNVCYGATTSYSYDPWYMGVDKPGSNEVSYMKSFFTKLPSWQSLIPRFYDTSYFNGASSEQKLIATTADAKTAVLYFYNTDTSTGTVYKLNSAYKYKAMWYNPRTGNYQECCISVTGTSCVLPAKPTPEDWALVITCEDISGFYVESPYSVKSAPTSISGTRLTPVSFTANGGSYYNKDLSLSDYSDYLIDNVPQTVWEPLNDRVTQTFVFDFGTSQSLSGIVISPESGTVLPNYRVYASNDKSTWYILNDTYLNATQHKIGDDYVETLSGSYRYVKVLLLNANGSSTDTDAYETFYNASTRQYCSHTAISEIAIYGSGSAAGTENRYEFSIPEKTVKTFGNTVTDDGWSTSMLNGNIERRTDATDSYVAYYCSETLTNTWYSPTLSIYDALKKLIEGSSNETVCVSFKIRADFVDGTVSSATVRPILRGQNGNGGYTVSKGSTVGTWRDAYASYCSGSSAYALFTESNGNILRTDNEDMWKNWKTFTVTEDWYEWHGTFNLSSASLNDAFLSDILVCVDQIYEYASIEELHFKDICVCLAGDSDAVHSFTPNCLQASTCTVCGYKHNATGHKYKAVTVYPTEATEGYTKNTCIYCNDTYTSNTTPCAKATIIGVNPILSDGISLCFYVSTTEKYSDAYMTFTYNKSTVTASPEICDIDGDIYTLCYRLNGILPQSIDSTVDLTLKQGSTVLAAKNGYSLSQYISDIKASSAEKLNITNEKFAFLCDLLDELTAYGEAAKAYVEGSTSSTSDSFIKLKSTDLQKSVSTVDTTQLTGAGLVIGEKISIYYTFTSECIDLTNITVAHGDSEAMYSESDFVCEGNSYKLYTDMLMPNEYDDVITVILKLNGSNVQRLTFSVASYVYAVQNNTEDYKLSSLAVLARNAYTYGLAAQKYVGYVPDKSYYFEDDVTVAAYYFPQWHNDPQNGKWTEWETLKNAVPRYENHNQPKTPAWGYLDESLPSTSKIQIEAASRSGIDVFIYDWYWDMNGVGTGPFLNRALENGFMQAENRSKMKFALMLCNHKELSRERWDEMTDYVIEHYLDSPEYWEIDGEKYFSIYELYTLVKGLGGIKQTVAALESFKQKALAKGYKLHINFTQWGLMDESTLGADQNGVANSLGARSVTSYVWIHNYSPYSTMYYPYSQWFEGYKSYWNTFDGMFDDYFPNVSMGWDSSGRYDPNKTYVPENNGYYCSIMSDNTPAAFKRALLACREFMETSKARHKVVTLYAWNEWTEGGYLEPEKLYGYGYLNAIRDVFYD